MPRGKKKVVGEQEFVVDRAEAGKAELVADSETTNRKAWILETSREIAKVIVRHDNPAASVAKAGQWSVKIATDLADLNGLL